jgi:hypothetical protein
MFVNKYKIIRPLNDDSSVNINLPTSQVPGLAGQTEIIESKFVDVEVKKSINDIIDYEKAKFFPINNKKVIADDITYIVNLYNDDKTYYEPTTTWANAGFELEDIQNLKNSFTKTFLRLDFYDNDSNTNQNLLFFITLFPKILIGDIEQDPNNINLQFKLGDSLKNRDKNGEGFFLYYFKDEVLPTVSKEIYMRASFLNAKTGEAHNLMSTDVELPINELIEPGGGKLYTKYILTREPDGYRYEIHNNNSNVTHSSNVDEIIVNLYRIKVQ